MSDKCLRKECAICGDRITGANYYCPNCKLCICFYCRLKIVLTEYKDRACPSCGNKLT